MFCHVKIRHSELNKEELTKTLRKQFGRAGLSAADWISKSARYQGLDGIDEVLIWGAHDEGGRILYGLIFERPDQTIIWAEHAGQSSEAFGRFRTILQSSAYSIRRSQRFFGYFARTVEVEESELYEVLNRPLGIEVKIQNVGTSRWGEITAKDLILPGIVCLVALFFNFKGQTKPASDYFFQLSTWTFPATYAWLAIFIWGIILSLLKYVSARIEVKFDV